MEAFRDVLYDLRLPDTAQLSYLVVVSTTVLAGGWSYFQAAAPDVSEEL